MIAYDTHVHTSFSTDSETPVRLQIEQAEALGMKGLCITDHMDYDFPKEAVDMPFDGEPYVFDMASYRQTLSETRPEHPGLELYTGVECGLQTTESVLQRNKLLAGETGLDYLIGSLHLVDRADPYYPSFWEDKNPEDCVRQYLEQLYDNLCLFHEFDALGHLDYIVRYAPDSFTYCPDDYLDLLDAILKLIIRENIALEINTAGLRKKGAAINPHPDILKLYRELGGELITIGSDAHSPAQLACGFDTLPLFLKDIGFREYVVYQSRQPVSFSL